MGMVWIQEQNMEEEKKLIMTLMKILPSKIQHISERDKCLLKSLWAWEESGQTTSEYKKAESKIQRVMNTAGAESMMQQTN